MIKVLALYADNAGCGFSRIKLPYTALGGEEGYDVAISDRLPREAINEADIIILQRPGNIWSLPITEWCKEQGKPLVVELDDVCWKLPPWNPFAKDWLADADGTTQSSWKIQQETLKRATAATVTTSALAAEVQPFQSNVFVIPNFIDIEMFEEQPHDREPITIGWSGSHSHLKDLETISGVIGRVMRRHPNTHLVTIGGYKAAETSLGHGVPEGRHSRWPWIENYIMLYQMMGHIDIGICPLAHDEFNLAKSSNKVTEYCAIGAPVIAEDFGPYHDFVKPDFGILVKSKSEWKDALHELISNKDKRLEMGRRARQVAIENDIRPNLWRYKDMIETVVGRYNANKTLQPV